jgi:hypothetical protein
MKRAIPLVIALAPVALLAQLGAPPSSSRA